MFTELFTDLFTKYHNITMNGTTFIDVKRQQEFHGNTYNINKSNSKQQCDCDCDDYDTYARCPLHLTAKALQT